MKSRLIGNFRLNAKRFVTVLAIVGIWLDGYPFHTICICAADLAPTSALPQSANATKVNRTLPQVLPPKTALEFSGTPTAQEIFLSRVFDEPLVPIGGEPGRRENAELAAALTAYSKRSSPDDFGGLTGFLQTHPQSPWRAALLLDLGLECYNTAHYSRALEAWEKAWGLAKDVTEPKGKVIGDRAVGELAYMYGRLGRMNELEALLKSVEGRVVCGPATEKISGARAGLSNMKDRPEIAFRCGPLALHRIKVSQNPTNAGDMIIHASASTQKGFSLPQVADLSQKLDLHYQMAFREKGAAFITPSVVHWKVGHYAAMLRTDGDRYLLQDPTFWNDVWVTKAALEEETSGYFLVPPGDLPRGWRLAQANEAATVWGKGNTTGNEPGNTGCDDPKSQGGASCKKPDDDCKGMAVPSVHLMLVSLNLRDEPVGYSPPVGPPVRFKVRYNQRESFQPGTFTYSNFGPKWTFDWLAYIKDNPFSPSADVQYYAIGGGTRTFTGFNPDTQTYAHQARGQTKLTRTATDRYEMLSGDGSKKVFSQPDGSAGTSRKIFLSQIIDPFGNTVSLTYDPSLRLVAITDAIGQVSTLSYQHPSDIYKITKVTDPFGRFATFSYDGSGRLTNITDVIGLTSQFNYEGASDFISSLVTPYGTTTFTKGESGTTRSLETLYPDGERDRVEFNQTINIFPASLDGAEPATSVPTGMATVNQFLKYRNTYYWSKIACAQAYGDYTKAKVYHWLHTPDLSSTSGVLESVKEPLEGRVWYNYPGQSAVSIIGSSDQPIHVGRVLDDGATQLYTHEYNALGKITKMIDPIGRTFSYIYSTNEIDLLEIRQTRAGNNELLMQTSYNAQHLPLTVKDAAGQVTAYSYNSRGQVITRTNARGAVTIYHYDTNGYRTSVDGPLPGTGDTTYWTYDAVGRVRTKTDVSGYTLTFDHDALDRLTRITFPDTTYDQLTYTRLNHTEMRDRAGRSTFLNYNSIGQMTMRIDPLGRVTRFQWCKCGDSKSITDPMGRTTTWSHDVQGRMTAKTYADGSKVVYKYENTTARLRERIDEQKQLTQYSYNIDNTLKGIDYPNSAVPTPSVMFTYDSNYQRRSSMRDGTGVTRYHYIPITGAPTLGAGQLASVDGPLPNDTITYAYDETSRRISTAINGSASRLNPDIADRIISETNVLGAFTYTYDGNSTRLASESFPNGQVTELGYGDNFHDNVLNRITYKAASAPISEFTYGRDTVAGTITNWSKQAGNETPSVYKFTYDNANQLKSAVVTQGGIQAGFFTYDYDHAANCLTAQTISATNYYFYNSLNELSSQTADSTNTGTYQWDAEQRLVSITSGNTNTQFSYDGLGRRVSIRHVVNGSEVSVRKFVWCDNDICEERDALGMVTKRFFVQGVRVETGAAIGNYYYTQDHLGSIVELVDSNANVRARYTYDPFGNRMRVFGDQDSDYGFAGMFSPWEVGVYLANYRAYDPKIGRWLSRDPLPNAELEEGPNLFAYVKNAPISLVDPLGLKCCATEYARMEGAADNYDNYRDLLELTRGLGIATVVAACAAIYWDPVKGGVACAAAAIAAELALAKAATDERKAWIEWGVAIEAYWECMEHCKDKGCRWPTFADSL